MSAISFASPVLRAGLSHVTKKLGDYILATEADTDEDRWEARLKAVAKPPAKLVKKGK